MKWCLRLRTVAAALAGLLALHLVVLVDTDLGWKLTLVAGEYGHRVAVLALALLVAGIRARGVVSLASSAILMVSAMVLLWPCLKAREIMQSLPARLEAGFGRGAAGATFQGLWLGGKPAAKTPEVHAYAEDDAGPRRIHFFRAENTRPAPCLVVLHGGGWENGRATEFPEWNAYWSSRGFAVACMEYRLAPGHPWPAQREDVRHALAWLKAHAAELGIDPQQFVLVGRSAGGQIATACATGLEDDAIRGCIALYAPHDMFFARRFAFEDDVLNSLRLLRSYLGGDPAEAHGSYMSASAFMLAQRRTCPILLLHGTRDTLVWNLQSRRLAGRLRDLGVPHLLVELPWAAHGFDWPFDGPGGQVTRVAVDSFLEAVCGK